MRAGRLSHRVTVLQKASTRSSTGAEVTTWSAVEQNIPAEVIPIAGKEYVALRQAQSDITVRFRMRYLAGVNSAMRVRWQGEDYDIREAIDVGARRTQLELLCVGPAGDV